MKNRWKEEWCEPLSQCVRNAMDPLLLQNKVWFKWHKTIYGNETTLSNEDIYKEEVAIGIDFRKGLGQT